MANAALCNERNRFAGIGLIRGFSWLPPFLTWKPQISHNCIICSPVKKIDKSFPEFKHAVNINRFFPNTKGIGKHPYVFLEKTQRAYEVFEKNFVLFAFSC